MIGDTIDEMARRGFVRANRANRTILVAATIPIAPIDPLAFFAAGATSRSRVFWQEPDQKRALVGIGEVQALEPRSPGRFSFIEDSWEEIVTQCVHNAGEAGDDDPAIGPILIGAYAFARARPRTAEWRALGAGCMVLPRTILAVTPTGQWLTACFNMTPGSDLGVTTTEVRRQVHVAIRSAGEYVLPTRIDERAIQSIRSVNTEDHYRSIVARATADIGRGHFQKVVLARALDVEAETAFTLEAALHRLRMTYPESTTYGLERGGAAFVGATPERLVRVRGRRVEASCLAGTARRGTSASDDDAVAADLALSPKIVDEHAQVLRYVQRSLARECVWVTSAEHPTVIRNRDLQHLFTPVVGELSSDRALFRAASRLHPTPAVGGVPLPRALDFIAEHENLDRGWYAGPFGWVGHTGDGDLAVAIRSGLLLDPVRDGYRRARLFAGCGIVADSNPDAELAETELKFRPMLGALGQPHS
jgi:isochorismate synthase